jgi:DNA-binding transcriptional LysR family regulator
MMIDLNLFRVFDAVMTERHVGRAAMHIGRTQPAVSNAIRRMRHVFRDPLFVRAPDGIRPTPRAEELWREIAPAMEGLSRTAQEKKFDSTKVSGALTVACTDFEATLLLRQIVKALGTKASAVDLVLLPGGSGKSQPLLMSGEADIALGFLPNFPSNIESRALFDDHFSVIMRKKHPLAKRSLKLADYCTASHLLVSPVGERRGFIDDRLSAVGKGRRVAVVVNHFHLAPAVLEVTDLIATLSSDLMKTLGTERLHHAVVPIPIGPVTISLYWHKRTHADQRLSFLRQMVFDACRGNGSR